jgi:hypothetical protein
MSAVSYLCTRSGSMLGTATHPQLSCLPLTESTPAGLFSTDGSRSHVTCCFCWYGHLSPGPGPSLLSGHFGDYSKGSFSPVRMYFSLKDHPPPPWTPPPMFTQVTLLSLHLVLSSEAFKKASFHITHDECHAIGYMGRSLTSSLVNWCWVLSLCKKVSLHFMFCNFSYPQSKKTVNEKLKNSL